MVKSGLETETAERYNEPRVSHYRLMSHLVTAFTFYSLLLWSGLSHLLPPQTAPITPAMTSFRKMIHGTKGTSRKGLLFMATVYVKIDEQLNSVYHNVVSHILILLVLVI